MTRRTWTLTMRCTPLPLTQSCWETAALAARVSCVLQTPAGLPSLCVQAVSPAHAMAFHQLEHDQEGLGSDDGVGMLHREPAAWLLLLQHS